MCPPFNKIRIIGYMSKMRESQVHYIVYNIFHELFIRFSTVCLYFQPMYVCIIISRIALMLHSKSSICDGLESIYICAEISITTTKKFNRYQMSFLFYFIWIDLWNFICIKILSNYTIYIIVDWSQFKHVHGEYG